MEERKALFMIYSGGNIFSIQKDNRLIRQQKTSLKLENKKKRVATARNRMNKSLTLGSVRYLRLKKHFLPLSGHSLKFSS